MNEGLPNNNDTQLSKTLSWLLRHGAVKEGLNISAEGYISIVDVLQHKSFRGKYNFADIERVVNNNNKKRFKLRLNVDKNRYEIKANQGHSIKSIDDKELKPILEPIYKTVVHGTYLANWNHIKTEGLSRMQRKHIHFAKGTLSDPNIISGLRQNAQVFIYIDLEKALADGIKFYESENGVILTEGDEKGYLKPKYFLKVSGNTGGAIAIFMMETPSKSQVPEALPDPKKIQVSGYPSYTQAEELKKTFSTYGTVDIEKISKNFAVLSFTTAEEAKSALEDSGKVNIYGQFLNVKPSIPRYEREDRKKPRSEQGTPKKKHPKSKLKDVSMVKPNNIDLSGDFYDQLDNLLHAVRLTQEEVSALSALYIDLEYVLQQLWPGCVAIPFGSITTGLGVKTSDADCFIQIPGSYSTASSSYVNKAKRILLRYPEKFQEIVSIPRANTPIVKFFHLPTHTNCDLTFKSPLGAQNSKLIAFLLHADPRLIPLAVVIKYWSKVHGFSGTGKLTNYALTLLIIFYLQQPPVSILPPVQWLQRDPQLAVMVDHWNTGFMSDRKLLPRSMNTSSISELLGGFFQYYSTFNFDEFVVCPLLGYAVKKEQFKDFDLLPEELKLYKQNVLQGLVEPFKYMRFMCIQDPFELCHNVSSAISFRMTTEISAFLQFAAAAYDKEKLNSCHGFLKILLLEKPKLPKSRVSSEFRAIIYDHYLHYIENPDWKGVVREVITKLFEEICQIKLTKLERPNIQMKKEKDKYTAVVSKAVWRRRQFTKFYNMTSIPFLEKQKRITDEVIANDEEEFKLDILLTVVYSNDTKSATVFLKHVEGDGDMFRDFGKFFMSFMHGWFVNLLKPYLKKKERSAGRVKKERASSTGDKGMEPDGDANVSTSDDTSISDSEDLKTEEDNPSP